MADLGVALLMFAVGIQFSLDELNHVRKTAPVGGGVQIAGTITLGVLLGLAFGWGVYGGLFLGCAIALSSTAVMLKVLEERGELGTSHGNVMLGILVVQDLSLVLMIVLLPALASLQTEGAGALAAVGVALLKALLFLGVTVLTATRGAPALLNRVARAISAHGRLSVSGRGLRRRPPGTRACARGISRGNRRLRVRILAGGLFTDSPASRCLRLDLFCLRGNAPRSEVFTD